MKIKSVKKINEVETNNLDHYLLTTQDDYKLGVPIDENNGDYQKILAWVAEGNTPEPADE